MWNRNFKHTDENFTGVIFRPATVYGCSNRMRFDLSVNILTNHAIKNKKILVFGTTVKTKPSYRGLL